MKRFFLVLPAVLFENMTKSPCDVICEMSFVQQKKINENT